MQKTFQVSKWAPAMVTMETFCMTDKNELLSVPPTSSVNIQNFFLRLCTLNLTELLVELREFQGQFQLEELVSLMHSISRKYSCNYFQIDWCASYGSIFISFILIIHHKLFIVKVGSWAGVFMHSTILLSWSLALINKMHYFWLVYIFPGTQQNTWD